MKDVHFSINPNKNAKQQALEVIKQLQTSGTLKIGRAEMKIRIQIPVKDAKKLKEKVVKVLKTKYSEEFDSDFLEIVSFSFKVTFPSPNSLQNYSWASSILVNIVKLTTC